MVEIHFDQTGCQRKGQLMALDLGYLDSKKEKLDNLLVFFQGLLFVQETFGGFILLCFKKFLPYRIKHLLIGEHS